MVFQEKELETGGYEYKVQDVFGEMIFTSDIKLSGDKLDGMVSLLLRQGHNAETVQGEVKHDTGTVTYKFTKEPQWADVPPEEEKEWDEPCENTPTSTKETESVFTQINRLISRIWKKLQRSVVAFRKAWKNPE
jgi:hypothetical protein